jgi:hypothetical protein
MLGTVTWGFLTFIAFCVDLVLLSIAFVYVRRLERQPTLPFSEEIGAAPRVIVAIRGNPMALCIPFTLFTLGCYYVLGSLEYLQGATPSERTFIGIIPMLTSTNLAIQLLRARRLKGRLRTAEVTA